MNVDRQFRKARTAIDNALNEGNLQKACYIANMAGRMSASIQNGAPRPWSEFWPAVQEEFDC